VTTEDDVKRVNDWIKVCIVLHNILQSFKDVWEDDDQPDDDEEARPLYREVETAVELRYRVQSHLLNWYRSKNRN
jgi:hypothetical protein